MKTYLLYYDFIQTSGNHAGMAHLVVSLSQRNKNIILLKHLQREGAIMKYLSIAHSFLLACYLCFKLKKEDKIFYFEYLTKGVGNQDTIAKILRMTGCKNRSIGLVHLSGEHLLELYNHKNIILKKLKNIDQVMVFGSSLAKFILEVGFGGGICESFHYVDINYYRPSASVTDNKQPLQVIFMGSLKRNFNQLLEIIQLSPSGIHFHVCMGKSESNKILNSYSNVSQYGFLKEDELLKLMQSCEVGLSVMDDTVGSNVITTSLAVGLVQIVSDVGSIRDYCDESNSLLCAKTEEFVSALSLLMKDKERLKEMSRNAIKRAQQLSIDRFYDEFVIATV